MNYSAYVVRSNRSLFGRIIRFFTGGDWDHVMISNGRNVIEMLPEGLKMWSHGPYARMNTIARLNLPELPDYKVMEWYSLNINIKYDWWRTLLWPFRKWISSGKSEKDNCIESLRKVYLFCDYESYQMKNYSPDELAKMLGIVHN